MSQSNIKQSTLVPRHYAKRDLTPWWQYVFPPQIYWKLLPQLAHTRQVDSKSSDFVFNRLVFTSSTCHLPFHTSFPESASGEQAIWSATESPIAFLGKTKIPNFARHHRLTRRCLSASNKVDGDHDDQDEQGGSDGWS